MQKKQLFSLLILSCLGSVIWAQETIAGNQMVRENTAMVQVDTLNATDNSPYIILSNYNGEEVLIVVTDLLGDEIFSKVIFKNQCAVLKASDPYNKIPSGVYTVTSTSRNEIYNQRIVVD